jgi:3-phenylpropionate/trans-cinnamate dioxygenase ferredoxin reductase component
MTRTVLIAGAGLAGSRVAETLRYLNFVGQIVLAGDEPHPPYERPALSKELLAGARQDVTLRPHEYWLERDIDLRCESPVSSVDTVHRTARVGGTLISWDALVVATGARARRLDGPPGLHTLRTLADAQRLTSEVCESTRLVIVGAGFIGAEVASTLANRTASTAIVEPQPAPLARVLGRDVGALLAARYQDHGVDVRLDTTVVGFHGTDRVTAVELDDGSLLPADVVVLGIGAIPYSPFGGEITVDEYGRSSLPGIYAGGDVAAWWRPALGRHLRQEHWTSAAGQARAVAASIAGIPDPYDDPPYFWSDQFGLRLQHIGHADGWHTVELEGNEEALTARYLDHRGHLRAALTVNRPQELPALRREIAWGVPTAAAA